MSKARKDKSTIRHKVGDSVKAKSGRIYLIEKLRGDGKLQGREVKNGKPYGPTRVFSPANVTQIALTTPAAAAKPASKKPVKKTPVPRTPVPKKASTASKKPASKKQPGCLEAAAVVLAKSKEPLSCPAIMERIFKQKLWSTIGKTPHQTLSSAIQREMTKKKKESRFIKTGRGLYAINPRKQPKAPKPGAGS